MIILYRILINIILILSPLVFLIRFFKKKETLKSYKEKLCFFSEKRIKGKLVWFHGASVGEFQSIVPLLEKLDKDKSIKHILVTSNTLSSSKIIEKIKIKKLIHQFFPIDSNFLSLKFLNYWKPSAAFFVDSEIWPNVINNLKVKKIPITLINGRITSRSYNRWIRLGKFSNNLFNKFDLCLSSSGDTKKYLKSLGAKNIKIIGNLKFSQSENEKIHINDNFKKIISSKNVWCAASTHDSEEIFCGLVHKKLKKKFKNLLTILIPRHIERSYAIEIQLKKIGLKVHTITKPKKISLDTDIILINAYGKSKSFYYICKNVFLGGSIINHGGQNPLEATKFGCNILHGPNVSNFKEIYHFLSKNNVAFKINHRSDMVNRLSKLLSRKNTSKKIQKKLKTLGQRILNLTFKEIHFIINKNEI